MAPGLAGLPGSAEKIPGAAGAISTSPDVSVAPERTTRIAFLPVDAVGGTTKLICDGRVASRGAATLSIKTWTPPSSAVRGRPAASALSTPLKFPNAETREPGDTAV